jgi:hypothetical protein
MANQASPIVKDRVTQYKDIVSTTLSIFLEKDKSYGNAFLVTGLLGVCCRIIGIAGRLFKLVVDDYHSGAGHPEKVLDALQDLLNYAAMGIICLEEENWKGKGFGNE